MSTSKSSSMHSLLSKRWSPKGFAPDPIPNQHLKTLFEAARWSPSSFNEQPWRFIYTKRGDNTYTQLLDCLSSGNKKWAGNAPILIVALSKSSFTYNDKPNRHHRYDLGQAIANLTVQALSMNYFVHQMAGFNPDKAREIFQVPDSFDVVTIVAIGKHSEEYLPESVSERNPEERSRKPLNELVFKDSWQLQHDL